MVDASVIVCLGLGALAVWPVAGPPLRGVMMTIEQGLVLVLVLVVMYSVVGSWDHMAAYLNRRALASARPPVVEVAPVEVAPVEVAPVEVERAARLGPFILSDVVRGGRHGR